MTDKPPLTYQSAGLDLDLYEQTLAGMAPLLRRTHTPRVLDGFGGFASLFSLDYNSRLFARNYRHPVLVSCTDGVGSKLKVAALAGKHDTVGIDLVAMSVNDCLCTGGEPLVFLDYLAMPKDDPALTRDLVKGISDGCMEAECSLVGGETAILPDFYQPGDYDMAGFCVGVVERDHIINGRRIQPGDMVLGLASTGIHSNGYSLVRKIVFEHAGLKIKRFRAGTGPDRRRGAAGADADLRPGREAAVAALPGEAARGPRPGPHHRRRAGGQRPAHPAAGPPRVPRKERAGRSRRSSAGCRSSGRSRKRRCSASSTWASASW